MGTRSATLLGLLVAATLGFLLAFNVAAQTKTEKLHNIQGRVQTISADASSIMIATGNGNVQRKVVYSADTKFMYGHSKDKKPGSMDAVKEGFYISCAGTYDGKNPDLMAKECVYREQK